MKVKEESEKVTLKLNIQKMKIQFHPFIANRWGNSDRIYFFCVTKSLQMVNEAIKLRYLLLGRKDMTNLDSALKSKDITLVTKVHIVKYMFFFSSRVKI